MTDEELCADVDLSDDEDDVDHKGAVGGARDQKRTSYECPDSKLSPSARVRLYFNNSWRMEVRWCGRGRMIREGGRSRIREGG